MFLSESDYDSLCTFPLQLSWGPHSHFFLLADYLLRYICDCICNFSHLQIISCAIFVTTFAIFPTCRLSPLYTCDHIRNFSHLQIISCSILVTAFALFLICRLSLLYTCDRIRTFSHLQIISCAILVTAFALFLICRLSLLYTCDRICNFSYLQIISCATPPLRLCWGCLQAGLSRVWTRNTRKACVTRCRLVSATKPTV